MKHLYKTTLLLLLALLIPAIALAYDFEVDGIYYNINGTEATVTSSPISGGYSGDIVIPASVTYNGTTYSVNAIGDNVFVLNPITSITIPSSVKNIGDFAFYNCFNLTSITIHNGVTNIGNHTFEGCSSLASITIPSSMQSIGDSAFCECNSLTSISIHEGLTSIGNSTFEYCTSLTSITIPTSVTTIGSSVFAHCSALTSVTILEGVTSISNNAFNFCTALSSITIPSSVTTISNYAFDSCTALSSITIPSSVTTIGKGVFWGCSSLTSITIPSSVTTINDMTFIGCSSLTSITIPSSVTCIGSSALCGCSSLTSITIPSSVASIGDYAFDHCTGLTSITIPTSVTSIGNDAFDSCPNLSIVFITGNGEWQAGALPEGIKTLHIDDEVTDVKGMQVNPEKIYSYATTPPVCDENSFTGYDAELHVPASSMAAYFTAPYWCNFTNIIGDAVMVTGLTLDQDNIKMEVGSQLTLNATIMPVSAMNQAVTWTTTNNTIATVDNGVVTAVAPGECNIVATCGNKQAICHLTVLEHLIYITLDQHETRLLPNHLITLTPTITPVETDLVVTSSNPAVAAARLAGNTIQVMGITEGTATIHVNSADGYAFSDSCLVEVYTERGDVNCDGFVNISDATSLIDALLDGGNVYSTENADCNNDGKVTITDLTMLIDALLGGTVLPEKERAMAPVSLEEMPKSSAPIAIKHWQAGYFE